MMPSLRNRAAVLGAAVSLALPLSTAAQTPTAPPMVPRSGWATSPLERVLERSETLQLTAEQTESLTTSLESWRTASAEPRARVEAFMAQVRTRWEENRNERREARRQYMEQRREAVEEGPDSLREGRREPMGVRPQRPRGMVAQAPGMGLDSETRVELRDAMASLRELRRDQMDLLRQVLSEDQLHTLRTEIAEETGMRRRGGSTPGPIGPRPRWRPRGTAPAAPRGRPG